MISNQTLDVLNSYIERLNKVAVACSGGIDSMLLAHIANNVLSNNAVILHSVTPAVQSESTKRFINWAKRQSWQFELISSKEFSDQNYLKNPINRCYYCKTNLYKEISSYLGSNNKEDYIIISGTNLDDLKEYRPGLNAALENEVKHPFVDCSVTKNNIRELAKDLNIPFHNIPSSPCLSSRIYTATEVTKLRLEFIEKAENYIRSILGIEVVRVRIREANALIETTLEQQHLINRDILQSINIIAKEIGLELESINLDQAPYSPGRSFISSINLR